MSFVCSNVCVLHTLQQVSQWHMNVQCFISTGVLISSQLDQQGNKLRSMRFQHRVFNFLQGKALKEIHAILTESLSCFLPGRAKDLSAPLYSKTNVSNLFYFGMTLYMFWMVFPSIIRSSRLYTATGICQTDIAVWLLASTRWNGYIARRQLFFCADFFIPYCSVGFVQFSFDVTFACLASTNLTFIGPCIVIKKGKSVPLQA